MSAIPKRKMDEIITLYTLNPSSRDVYVEGPFDKYLIAWFAEDYGLGEIKVYDIGTIDIPEEELISKSLAANNKGRVICLSQFFSSRSIANAVCIVDADFDYLRRKTVSNSTLLTTDYSCMEMYLFDGDILKKFFYACYHDDWPIPKIMDEITKVLVQLFIYRYVNDELNWEMDNLDCTRCMELQDWSIIFDTEEYVKRLLNKNSRLKYLEDFNSETERLETTLMDDPRYQVHGHDYFTLLLWYTKKKGIDGLNDKKIKQLFLMAITAQSLAKEVMFVELIKRVS